MAPPARPTGNLSRIATIGIGVAVAVLALKVWAWLLTGSIAIFSDAVESTVNVATAVIALVAVRLAARPADAALPYGYHKAEYVSAVLEGVFILVAAISIAQAAFQALIAPHALSQSWEGLAVAVIAALVNAAWSAVLLQQGRRSRSPALGAEGRHILTDVMTTAGVVVGLILAWATGWAVLDPLLALAVAALIVWSGWDLMRSSVGGLMDVAAPAEMMTQIRAVIGANAEGAIEAHDIRSRRAGQALFIDFHLVVPGTMPVETAHAICDRIETALQAAFAGVRTTIHVEPDSKAKHSGIVVL